MTPEELVAEVERLRAALAEYANEDRWTEGEFGVGRYIWRSDKSVPGFNQNANGYDLARRALSASAETASPTDDDPPMHGTCLTCGGQTDIVRPGKYQCNHCGGGE